MEPIIIQFTTNNLGRVEFRAGVQTGDGLSHKRISFKLDSGSDFTTLSCEDLSLLGYSREILEACPFHGNEPSTAFSDTKPHLRYMTNISITFGDRELQNCRIFFALDTKLKSLFGSDILKYLNREINYDEGKLYLRKRIVDPKLSRDETPIQIYSLD